MTNLSAVYDIKVDAPAGAVIVSVDAETADRVRRAVLLAVLNEEPVTATLDVAFAEPSDDGNEPVAEGGAALAADDAFPGEPVGWHVEPKPKRKRKKRAGFLVVPEVIEQTFDLLPVGRAHAVTTQSLLIWLNAARDQQGKRPVSDTTLDRALAAILEFGLVKKEVGIRPDGHPKARYWYLPENGDQRKEWRATLVAGVGLKQGSLA